MRTVGELIAAAYNASKRAQPDVDATQEDLVSVLQARLTRYFIVGAAANPAAFMHTSTVPWSGEGWARPSEALMVHRIEDAGAEVAVVPYDQQDIEPGRGCVYRLGQEYQPVLSNSRSPRQGAVLRFYYTKMPSKLATSNSAEIDPLWPRGHERMLAVELAIYLATKDGRETDRALLDAELEMEREHFLTALTAAEVPSRRMGIQRGIHGGGSLEDK